MLILSNNDALLLYRHIRYNNKRNQITQVLYHIKHLSVYDIQI